jgi:membrane protease subunit HflC
MQAERQRIASALRAEGAQEDAEIRAETDRDVTVTLQTAEGDSAKLRGEGEGEAIAILAEELERDPEFYKFQRALTAYKTLLDSQTTVVLSADSPLFEFLQDPAGAGTGD